MKINVMYLHISYTKVKLPTRVYRPNISPAFAWSEYAQRIGHDFLLSHGVDRIECSPS